MTELISTPKHVISLLVAGVEIIGWESYSISKPLVEQPDTFTMRLPFTREAWDLCQPDRLVQVRIDGVPVITGFIDDSDVPEDSYVIEITGRGKIGRLIDESAPTLNFSNLGILELITKLASPWFTKVTFSGLRDRTVQRGRGRKARASGEPLLLNVRKKLGTIIEPGQTRWQAIKSLLDQAGLIAWASGDGKELIISKPNYKQEVQFRFFRPSPGSRRVNDATVLAMGVKRSTGDRYSRIIVVGSGTGTDINYGAKVASRYGEAKNNDDTADGEGIDFSVPKRLIVQRSVKSIDEAEELAEREMARRDAQGYLLTVRAAGHGQLVAGAFTTLFANNLLASCEHEPTGTVGTYAIVGCTFAQNRSESATTTMNLVCKGAEIAA
ncbi:MAG: hypothetical protein H0U52_06815 [Chloroflexi bacterium]|nr:hypothetical protein [Chloroflexota bacterium]